MSNDMIRYSVASSRPSRRIAGAFLALCAVAAALPAPGFVVDLLADGVAAGTDPVDATVLALASVVVWSVLGWGCLVLLLAGVGRLPGTAGRSALHLLRVTVPRTLRPLLVAGVGAGVVSGLTGCAPGAPSAVAVAGGAAPAAVALPAQRADLPEVPLLRLDWPVTAELGGQPEANPPPVGVDWPVTPESPPSPQAGVPDRSRPVAPPERSPADAAERGRPAGAAGSGPEVADPAAPAPAAPVLVRPGDSLWSIAAARLPADAAPADVDLAWRSWYAANADLIGPDPDLILPGQQLNPPTEETDR